MTDGAFPIVIHPDVETAGDMPSERLRASAVSADSSGGTYCIESIGTIFPVVAGDIMAAAVNGRFEMQAFGMLSVRIGTYAMIDLADPHIAGEVMDSLESAGAYVFCSPLAVTCFWPAQFSTTQATSLVEQHTPLSASINVLDSLARSDTLADMIRTDLLPPARQSWRADGR